MPMSPKQARRLEAKQRQRARRELRRRLDWYKARGGWPTGAALQHSFTEMSAAVAKAAEILAAGFLKAALTVDEVGRLLSVSLAPNEQAASELRRIGVVPPESAPVVLSMALAGQGGHEVSDDGKRHTWTFEVAPPPERD